MTSRFTLGPVKKHPSDIKVMTLDVLQDLDDAGDLLTAVNSVTDVTGSGTDVTASGGVISADSYLGWPRNFIPANNAFTLNLQDGADGETRTLKIVLSTSNGRSLTYYLLVKVDANITSGPISKLAGDSRAFAWEFIKEMGECSDTITSLTSLTDPTADAGQLTVTSPQVIVADTEIGTPSKVIPANKGLKFGLEGGVAGEQRTLLAVFQTSRGSTLYRKLLVDVKGS